jgi:hypothetical protein
LPVLDAPAFAMGCATTLPVDSANENAVLRGDVAS